MPSSDLIVALNARIREAFDEAWLAIFEPCTLGRREGTSACLLSPRTINA